MLTLYLESPFAVCRTFTAGWYRPSSTFLTPSAAYGLLLNLAGIETRLCEEDEHHPGKVPATLTRSDLPALKIALGAPTTRREHQNWREAIPEAERYPLVQSIYQQLHNYPVGSSGGERAATTFGNKYNITPVRREVLVNLRAVVAIDGNSGIESQIRLSLTGVGSTKRYGLPFLGDNSFLPDRIDVLEQVPTTHWYQRVVTDQKVQPRATRLTIWIDRADTSQTKSDLYAPSQIPSETIPPEAWTEINPP